MPADQRAGGVVAEFPVAPGAGDGQPQPAVLLPQAAGAAPELRVGLEQLGWRVDAVVAYRTLPVNAAASLLQRAAGADAICFASPSALESYLSQAAEAGAGLPPVVACIGAVTAEAARSHGLDVVANKIDHTVEGLVGSVVGALSGAPASWGLAETSRAGEIA